MRKKCESRGLVVVVNGRALVLAGRFVVEAHLMTGFDKRYWIKVSEEEQQQMEKDELLMMSERYGYYYIIASKQVEQFALCGSQWTFI